MKIVIRKGEKMLLKKKYKMEVVIKKEMRLENEVVIF